MHCICAQFYVLFFYLVWLLASIVLSELGTDEPSRCGGEYRNVDVGEILPPENVSSIQTAVCTWILSAPPGKKLLVNVDRVSLLNNEDAILTLYVDGDEVDLPSACEQCKSNIVGGILKVALELMRVNVSEDSDGRVNLTNGVNVSRSDLSFLISYKSFDPHSCETPESPSNGYFVEKGRSEGSKIRYVCFPPYELIGNSKSTCITTEKSPVPVWSYGPPQCAILPCNGRVLSRTAGKGMIVHPGYPSKTVLSGQHCEWHVRADGSRKVLVNIKYFSLPLGEKKRKNDGTSLNFYDGSHDNLMLRLRGQENPRLLMTTSNHLILVLQTDNITKKSNDATDAFGFYVEYAATCESLEAPANGSVISESLVVGSNASFQCNEGFSMHGSSVLICLLDANWSTLPPTCQFQFVPNATITSVTNTSISHRASSNEYDDEEDSFSDGFSTNTLSMSATDDLVTSPTLFSTTINDSFTTDRTTYATGETTPAPESGHFSGKGNRKADVPAHQNANAKSYITKTSKEEENGKSLASGIPNTIHHTQDQEKHKEEPVVFSDVMIILIVSAIATSVVLGLLLLGGCLWYRKQYPVRMNFGRKFETFENPIYQTRGKKTSSSSPTVPEGPAELQRLTAARLSL